MQFSQNEEVLEDFTVEEQKVTDSEHIPHCPVCLDLEHKLWGKDWQHTLHYSKCHDATTTGCQICRCICDILGHFFPKHFPTFVKAGGSQKEDRFNLSFHEPGFVSVGRWRMRFQVMVYTPLQSGAGEPALSSSRYSGPEISLAAGTNELFSKVTRFISDCIANHEDCRKQGASKPPKRVIDLGESQQSNKMKLLETSDSMLSYAALSHCWGQHVPLHTTKSSLALRKQTIEWESLPATFKDAITATRRLGLRYLWIDSLCIVQDDGLDWQIESAQMGSYYRNAHIVIAASSSPDPTCSFLEPRQTIFANPLQFDIQRKDGSKCKIKARPFVQDGLGLDPLDKRTWTFQEQYLATRLLRYKGQELEWMCRSESHCECKLGHVGLDDDIWRATRWGRYCTRISEGDGALGQWQNAIHTYTSRQLTKKSDKLPAISGIAAIVQQGTGSSYVAGLWKDSILEDLWWRTEMTRLSPIDFDFEVTAHIGADEVDFLRLRASPTYIAPSFSWASIDSEVVGCVRTSRIDTETDWGCGTYSDAEVLDVQCTVKGANPFGEVTDGFIVIKALLADAVVKVAYDDMGVLGDYIVYRKGNKVGMRADLPLVPGLGFTDLGEQEPTVKRASTSDVLTQFTGTIYCLFLHHTDEGGHRVLVLGRSERVSGAYERLGLMELACGSYGETEWFEGVKPSIVTIV